MFGAALAAFNERPVSGEGAYGSRGGEQQRNEGPQLASIFEQIVLPEEVDSQHADHQDWGNYWHGQFVQVRSSPPCITVVLMNELVAAT